MAATGISAREAARRISADKRVTGTVTDKAVRDMARSILPAHDKVRHPRYTRHGYTAAQYATLLAAFVARSAGKATKPKPAPKPTRKAATAARSRKAAPSVTPDA